MRKYIGPQLLRPGTLEEDQKEATDLIVLKADGIRIACRVRTPGYLKWKDEITITAKRESQARCEWDKMIVEGLGDMFFYGHATCDVVSEPKADIHPRYLIDLRIARPWILANPGELRGPNKDAVGRRCWFRAFNLQQMKRELGNECIVAANPEVDGEDKLTPELRGWRDAHDEWLKRNTDPLTSR